MPEDVLAGDDVAGDLVVDIVVAIAGREDIEATEVAPPLSNVIDTDALGEIVGRSRSPIRVTFEYLGYEVTVATDGNEPSVFVRER